MILPDFQHLLKYRGLTDRKRPSICDSSFPCINWIFRDFAQIRVRNLTPVFIMLSLKKKGKSFPQNMTFIKPILIIAVSSLCFALLTIPGFIVKLHWSFASCRATQLESKWTSSLALQVISILVLLGWWYRINFILKFFPWGFPLLMEPFSLPAPSISLQMLCYISFLNSHTLVIYSVIYDCLV